MHKSLAVVHRRAKQFVNLFRLRVLIAFETGLFEAKNGRRSITPEQIGKFTVISMMWPQLIKDALQTPVLLSELENGVSRPEGDEKAFNRWHERRDLMALLQIGVKGENVDNAWSLKDLDLDILLRVSPLPGNYINTLQHEESNSGQIIISGLQ